MHRCPEARASSKTGATTRGSSSTMIRLVNLATLVSGVYIVRSSFSTLICGGSGKEFGPAVMEPQVREITPQRRRRPHTPLWNSSHLKLAGVFLRGRVVLAEEGQRSR